MKTRLSSRQNKIIQILRNSNRYMTSEEISGLLKVASKTVRLDIADINDFLAPEGICIDSVKGKGFVLCAQDPTVLDSLSKDDRLFLERSDRVNYIAERLCTTSGSVNTYDLEEEMSVSSSTLSGDIAAFRSRFVNGTPYIQLSMSKNELYLEDDERSRRYILVKLLTDSWDYNRTGPVPIESDYADSETFNLATQVVAKVLYEHGISMDDYSLLFLNLYLSIIYLRVSDGHLFNGIIPDAPVPPEIPAACRDFFSILEEKQHITYPENEKAETAYMIYEIRLHGKEDFKARIIPDKYRIMARQYQELIKSVYGLDLSDDDQFNDRLISFIAHMYRQMKDLDIRDTPERIKDHLFVEYDVALLFYQIIEKECRITESDFLYLTWAISGAFFRYFEKHPEARFNAVVISHMSVHAMWSLKCAVIDQFECYLNVKDVIPVNQKDLYDYSKVDLVLSTIDAPINDYNGIKLTVSPYLSRDNIHTISDHIRNLKIQRLFPANVILLSQLLDEAFVHEKMTFPSKFSLIEFMCRDFINEGIFTQDIMFHILEKEAISSYASHPALLLLYSISFGTTTRLSVVTLDHLFTWNKFKIRTVIMASFAKEDANELFYLQYTLFHQKFDPEALKSIKTIEELKDHYK